MSHLSKSDPEIAAIISAEQRRQAMTLEMIASENHASAAVLEATGTILTDKYAEGYPYKRYYCGCENMDAVEQLAIDRAKKLFGVEHANVQPHSGTTANLAVYMAAIKPGAKIMGMSLAHGGHLSHGMSINLSGHVYQIVSYGVRQDTEMMDLNEIRQIAKREKPDLMVVGASAYPRIIDFSAFGEIAREVGCLLMADIAHIVGLVVAGVHPDPVPHTDFVTATTHKTLRGPRGGIVLSRNNWAKKIDSAVFPGLQGGPLMHVIAAKAVAFHEALRPSFKKYGAAIVANAKTLSERLISKGWRLVSGGTDNHLMLIDLRSRDQHLSGKLAADWLASAGIIVNKNVIPFDVLPPTEASGIRIGTPALTTRGMGADQMEMVADWIDLVLASKGGQATVKKVKDAVEELCVAFPIPNDNNNNNR